MDGRGMHNIFFWRSITLSAMRNSTVAGKPPPTYAEISADRRWRSGNPFLQKVVLLYKQFFLFASSAKIFLCYL